MKALLQPYSSLTLHVVRRLPAVHPASDGYDREQSERPWHHKCQQHARTPCLPQRLCGADRVHCCKFCSSSQPASLATPCCSHAHVLQQLCICSEPTASSCLVQHFGKMQCSLLINAACIHGHVHAPGHRCPALSCIEIQANLQMYTILLATPTIDFSIICCAADPCAVLWQPDGLHWCLGNRYIQLDDCLSG